MIKKFLLMSLLFAFIVLGIATNSKAVIISGNDGSNDFPLANCNGVCTYLAAYEFYGNKAVIAGGDSLDTIVKFTLGTNYAANAEASIILTGAEFLKPSDLNGSATQYCLVDASNNVVAVQNGTLTFPTNQLFLTFPSAANSGTKLTLALCDDQGKYVADMTQVQLDPNLSASCNTPQIVKIKWNYPGDCCEANFITIKAKSVINSQPLDLTAELDTDKDFQTFLGGYTIRDACCTPGTANCNCGVTGQCFSSSGTTPTGCPAYWVLGSTFDPANMSVAKFSFDLVSLFEEKGIKEVRFTDGQTKCTTTDNKTWHCSSDCMPCPLCSSNTNKVEVEVKGDTELNPTLWTLANPSVTQICPIDPRVKDICCNLLAGSAGAWYGGLEAIVPFVKKSDSANTYIKLFNRYNKDAKLYVQVFNKSSDSMILAVNQIPGKEVIPAGGVLQITGDDFMNICPNCDWNAGQAVKFLIRVPSQAGCMSISGSVLGTISSSTYTGTFTGTNCYNNAKDPYIEGIVISVYGSEQRSVPLKFKFFKQGSYNE